MGASELLVIIGVPVAAVSAAAVFGLVLPRMKRARQRRRGITLAAFADPSIVLPPRPSRPAPEPDPSPASSATPHRPEPRESPFAPPRREAATGTLGGAWAEPNPADPPRLRLETAAERTVVAGADAKPGRRTHRPADGTLQFLQGRLEVIEGGDIGQEIRFVREPNAATTEVTFGRQDGTPYRHVQLHEPTVSRLHAKMTLEDKDWRLTNLSATNPASVNGSPLGPENGSVLLHDGDRVEMGAVVFRFRAK